MATAPATTTMVRMIHPHGGELDEPAVGEDVVVAEVVDVLVGAATAVVEGGEVVVVVGGEVEGVVVVGGDVEGVVVVGGVVVVVVGGCVVGSTVVVVAGGRVVVVAGGLVVVVIGGRLVVVTAGRLEDVVLLPGTVVELAIGGVTLGLFDPQPAKSSATTNAKPRRPRRWDLRCTAASGPETSAHLEGIPDATIPFPFAATVNGSTSPIPEIASILRAGMATRDRSMVRREARVVPMRRQTEAATVRSWQISRATATI
jgi:hypothetical protein